MPGFVIIPANQVAAKPTKSTGQRGRPLGTSNKQAAKQKTSPKRSTVSVVAFGGKLFEPIMTKERPIYVHFTEYIVRDDDAITRFSEDGFFGIKFFLTKQNGKSRCYLAYFKNPISPTPNHNLMQACQEAIDYDLVEFEDDEEYARASMRKDKEGLCPQDAVKLRLLSALGKAEQKIIEILQGKIIAEKFLKRQQEYEKQNEAWKNEFARLAAEEEENELDDASDESSESGNESSSDAGREEFKSEENKKEEEVLEEERKEVADEGLQSEEIREGDEPKILAPKPVGFVWGGKK